MNWMEKKKKRMKECECVYACVRADVCVKGRECACCVCTWDGGECVCGCVCECVCVFEREREREMELSDHWMEDRSVQQKIVVSQTFFRLLLLLPISLLSTHYHCCPLSNIMAKWQLKCSSEHHFLSENKTFKFLFFDWIAFSRYMRKVVTKMVFNVTRLTVLTN